MWKKLKLVMLSTNKKVHDTYMIDNLEYHSDDKKISYNGIEQHLYIISDEKIKEGDWFLEDDRINIHQNNGNPDWVLRQCTSIFNSWIGCNNTKDIGYNPDWCKKIIASTDLSLKLKTKFDTHISIKSIPQIPKEFISLYIEEYNKGNIIEEVEVEYEEYAVGSYGLSDGEPIIDTRLKLNSNNEISIKLIKESWSREEVIEILMKFDTDSSIGRFNGPNTRTNWIKENL
jgi:hypothetical protein